MVPANILIKRGTKRFPALRSPLHNPRLQIHSFGEIREWFKGRPIEKIAKERNDLISPFLLYSEYVIDEIYRLLDVPTKKNFETVRKLLGHVIPSEKKASQYYHITVRTTFRNCLLAIKFFEHFSPLDEDWKWKKSLRVKKAYDKDFRGKKGKALWMAENSYLQIINDAVKEFEWFKPLMRGETPEEKWADFIEMLREFGRQRGTNLRRSYRDRDHEEHERELSLTVGMPAITREFLKAAGHVPPPRRGSSKKQA